MKALAGLLDVGGGGLAASEAAAFPRVDMAVGSLGSIVKSSGPTGEARGSAASFDEVDLTSWRLDIDAERLRKTWSFSYEKVLVRFSWWLGWLAAQQPDATLVGLRRLPSCLIDSNVVSLYSVGELVKSGSDLVSLTGRERPVTSRSLVGDVPKARFYSSLLFWSFLCYQKVRLV